MWMSCTTFGAAACHDPLPGPAGVNVSACLACVSSGGTSETVSVSYRFLPRRRLAAATLVEEGIHKAVLASLLFICGQLAGLPILPLPVQKGEGEALWSCDKITMST